jgi:hypothetical protein
LRPEHRFSKDLTKALEAYGCLVLSIETGPTNRGVPDLFIAKQGRSLWIELKVVSPKQEKEPRTAIQIKRQSEMIAHGVRVLNAHDVRDAKDFNIEYRLLGSTPHSNFLSTYGLADAILSVLAE